MQSIVSPLLLRRWLYAASATLALLLPVDGWAEPVRILLIGDHFIGGRNSYVGFRYDLWFALRDAGYDVEFVGSLSEAGGGTDGTLYPALAQFDPDHEGYTDTYSGEIAGKVDSVMGAFDPDAVILMMGWQDLHFNMGQGADEAAGWINFSVSVVRAHRPEAPILIGLLPPLIRDNAFIPQLNSGIVDIANNHDAPGARVIAIDNQTGFETSSMLGSVGVSPNRTGEMLIAERFFEALQAVLPEPTGGSNFQINAGINDAWYNPDTPGQGFFFNVFPNLGLMFIAWFTYDTERPGQNVSATLGEPGHRWITGIGPYDGDSANIVLELTEGGLFDTGDPPVMQTQGYGSFDITFQDCQFATVAYNIPGAGVSGSIDVQRIVADNIPLCQSLAGGAQ